MPLFGRNVKGLTNDLTEKPLVVRLLHTLRVIDHVIISDVDASVSGAELVGSLGRRENMHRLVVPLLANAYYAIDHLA